MRKVAMHGEKGAKQRADAAQLRYETLRINSADRKEIDAAKARRDETAEALGVVQGRLPDDNSMN